MTLPLHNPKKLLYAVWIPNGHDILVTSASNINTLVDVRKEAVIKALPNDIEVRPHATPSFQFLHVCQSTAATRTSTAGQLALVHDSGTQLACTDVCMHGLHTVCLQFLKELPDEKVLKYSNL